MKYTNEFVEAIEDKVKRVRKYPESCKVNSRELYQRMHDSSRKKHWTGLHSEAFFVNAKLELASGKKWSACHKGVREHQDQGQAVMTDLLNHFSTHKITKDSLEAFMEPRIKYNITTAAENNRLRKTKLGFPANYIYSNIKLGKLIKIKKGRSIVDIQFEPVDYS